MAHDRDEPVLEFKPEYFTVNATGSYDVSYSALASLAVLGVSFEQSTVATLERIKYITTGKSGLPPDEVLFTDIGNDDEHPQLRVYGLIKGHYGLDVDGDVSFNNNFFVSGDSSFNSNLSIGNNLSLNGNLYVGKSSLFIGDVSLNGNVKMGSGSNSISVNKDISAGYAFDVSGLTIFRNTMYVASDVSFGSKFFVNGDVSLNKSLLVGQDVSLNGNLYVGKSSLFIGDVSLNGNVKMGSGFNTISVNKDISAGYAFDVSGLTIFRNTMYVASDVSFGAKLFVNGDVSLNKSLLVGQDISLNGNLYVGKSSLFIGDVSLNGNVKMGSGSNTISVNKDISAGYAFDVSGLTIFRNTMYVASDVSLGAKLFVNGDVSLNKSLLVGQDVSLNGNLYVGKSSLFIGDVSLNGNVKMGAGSNFVVINKDISAGYAFDVSGLTIFRNTMYVASDVSFGSKLFVNGDVSLNKSLLVGQDVSLNGNLYVGKSSLFIGDVSLNGNVKMGSGSNSVVINKDISAGYAFDVSGLTIFRNTVYVVSDASLGVGFFVNGDISLNRNLSVGGDLSLNGNVKMGFGSNSVVINKDISAGYAFDVSGRSQVRGNLDVAGVFTVNGAPISAGGVSLTGNVQVGSNSGFVSIDKPYFYSDPSLTIYYNFDTSINNGTQIKNNATTTTIYDGSLNVNGVSSAGMIDTSIFKYGAASLKNNPAINNGVQILPIGTNIIPVGTIMTFSLWVNVTVALTSPSTYRIFEFTDNTSGPNSDNNNIALDIHSSGIILPILKYGNNSCFTTLTSPIITYSVINTGWNHIAWVINSSTNISYIYINGSIKHYDTITNSFPLTSRNSGFIAYSYLGGNEYNGNIDNFRYYKDKALSYAEIYQLYNNNFYTFDICGGFLANGSSVIYEPVGSVATANRGTLTLLHGDASGSSSIMFKSVNDPLEYAYIEYDENVTGSTGYNYGLLTIGIENDAGSGSTQADRISLFPSGGTGFVGVNTKTPQTALDVTGTTQSTSFNATSDYREKDNVMELDESFTVDTLRPVVYYFKPLGKKHVGFLAHEVQEFYPFLVSGEKDGVNSQSLNYNGFIGILTKEIQVLKKKVADQEAKALEQEAKALEQEAKALEQEAKALEQEARIQALEQSVKTLEKFILNK